MLPEDRAQEARLDPDNYLQIPEFHILPAGVKFAGFGVPVVLTFPTDDEAARTYLYSALRALRHGARARFTTLADLNAARNRLITRTTFETSPERLNEQWAYRYHEAIAAMSAAIDLNQPLQKRNEASAKLAAILVSLDERGMEMIVARELGRKGGAGKAERTRKAREWVQRLWRAGGHGFQGKTEFARFCEKEIPNRFRDGTGAPLKVKLETITDLWLSEDGLERSEADLPSK